MTTRRHFLPAMALLTAALISTVCVAPAAAQTYPSKPITIVVAYPAGGDTDALARLFAEKLTSRMGQPVLVDNRPGASGTIGSSFVSKAPADGYTLLQAPSTFSTAPLVLKTGAGAQYDVLNGFTPVIQAGTQPLFIAANSSVGAKDMKELIALAKTQPLTFASPGSGSPMHILGEMLNKSADVKIGQIPYRGSAPAVNDLIGGHVPVTYMTLGPIAPHVASGKVNIFAVADLHRSPLAPNVPTLAELGYKDVDVVAWQGLFGPKGMPADVVKTLNGHLNEILKMPDVISKMNNLGIIPTGGTPAVLEKASAHDFERFGKVIKEFNILAD